MLVKCDARALTNQRHALLRYEPRCAVQLTSSLTFKVAGVAKNVATMVIGVTVLGETVSAAQAAGYFVATAATVYYSMLRRVGVRSTAKPVSRS